MNSKLGQQKAIASGKLTCGQTEKIKTKSALECFEGGFLDERHSAVAGANHKVAILQQQNILHTHAERLLLRTVLLAK